MDFTNNSESEKYICLNCLGGSNCLFGNVQKNRGTKNTKCAYCDVQSQCVELVGVVLFLYLWIGERYEENTFPFPGGDLEEKIFANPACFQSEKLIKVLLFSQTILSYDIKVQVTEDILNQLAKYDKKEGGSGLTFIPDYWWQTRPQELTGSASYTRWIGYEKDVLKEDRITESHEELFEDIVKIYLLVISIDNKQILGYVGPDCTISELWRVRNFDSRSNVEKCLESLKEELGALPSNLSHLASATRMASKGDPAFYGGEFLQTAIAEVRPPVGSTLVCTCFHLQRKCFVFDTTISEEIKQLSGDIFLPKREDILDFAKFLQYLEKDIARPVIGGDSGTYAPTQKFCDFLRNVEPQFEGIVFHSAQYKSAGRNVALFDDAKTVCDKVYSPSPSWLDEQEIGWGPFGVDPYDSNGVINGDDIEQVFREYELKGVNYGDGKYPTFVDYIRGIWNELDHIHDLESNSRAPSDPALVLKLDSTRVLHVTSARFDLSTECFFDFHKTEDWSTAGAPPKRSN